jgi:hypothetical protein
MGFSKRIVYPIFIIFLVIGFSGCSKYEEPVPFFDGMFLEYGRRDIMYIYNFESIENYSYKLVKTEKREPLRDKITDFYVDTYGRVYESSDGTFEGDFSFIWIPVNVMEIGDEFDGRYTVSRRDRYRKWDVLVIKAIEFDVEHYFEINTGYLVGVKGKFGMAFEFYLINTNADIPTIEP